MILVLVVSYGTVATSSYDVVAISSYHELLKMYYASKSSPFEAPKACTITNKTGTSYLESYDGT